MNSMEKVEHQFQTIREACASTGLSQTFLRRGCRDGSIPHLRSGRKYYVNVAELIKAASKKC